MLAQEAERLRPERERLKSSIQISSILARRWNIELLPQAATASSEGEARSITGHIDFLQIRNGAIHILDYKPDAQTNKPLAQLTTYALALSHLTGIPLFDFKCARFNERQYCEFFPRTVLARCHRIHTASDRARKPHNDNRTRPRLAIVAPSNHPHAPLHRLHRRTAAPRRASRNSAPKHAIVRSDLFLSLRASSARFSFGAAGVRPSPDGSANRKRRFAHRIGRIRTSRRLVVLRLNVYRTKVFHQRPAALALSHAFLSIHGPRTISIERISLPGMNTPRCGSEGSQSGSE